ncbi:MAG TPA: hypothetical protein VN888_07365 [Mycobacterium sp.]|nr:hypothetical protein [Mycobacterium sp.]
MNVAYLASGLTGLIPILAIGFVFYMRRRYSAPKFNGPALTGTAQILSLKTTASSEGNSGVPMQLCRLGVRVEVPGRGPYEVTVRHSFAPWAMPAVGSTVAVEVDSTDPSKVRLRVTGPMQRSPQARSFGSSQVLGDPANPVNVRINLSQPPTVGDQAAAYQQNQGGGAPVLSAADLLASGQRVRGVLKSFGATGTTPRSLGRTPSKPELIDAPHYVLGVELQFPNLAPIDGRAIQPVPLAQVPNLAIGLPLPCVVDPADPSHRFVVDWGDTAH